MMKLEEIGTRARQAEPVLRIMETEKKNRVLKKAAENLVADAETIIAANAWKRKRHVSGTSGPALSGQKPD